MSPDEVAHVRIWLLSRDDSVAHRDTFYGRARTGEEVSGIYVSSEISVVDLGHFVHSDSR